MSRNLFISSISSSVSFKDFNEPSAFIGICDNIPLFISRFINLRFLFLLATLLRIYMSYLFFQRTKSLFYSMYISEIFKVSLNSAQHIF